MSKTLEEKIEERLTRLDNEIRGLLNRRDSLVAEHRQTTARLEELAADRQEWRDLLQQLPEAEKPPAKARARKPQAVA